jgi:hypothetical protein
MLRSAFFGLCAAMTALWPLQAEASACNNEIIAHIAFAKGQMCWRYHGNATTFVGTFAAGQKVSVTMRGLETDYDPKTGHNVTFMANRSPDVSGPDKFYVMADIDKATLDFVTPAAGGYRFGFSPCAMWGAPGDVEICAR